MRVSNAPSLLSGSSGLLMEAERQQRGRRKRASHVRVACAARLPASVSCSGTLPDANPMASATAPVPITSAQPVATENSPLASGR